jgi:hypothetical protein
MASGWEFLPKNLTLRSPVRVFLACAEGIPPTHHILRIVNVHAGSRDRDCQKGAQVVDVKGLKY